MSNLTMGLPFVRGSATSEDAAAAKRGSASSDQERVYAFISGRWIAGATDDEIEEILGMRHQNASARRNALVRAGRVKDSGLRRPTRSGREATVWVVGKGLALVGAPNDRVGRPNAEALRAAATELDRAHPALADVARWLRHIAR